MHSAVFCVKSILTSKTHSCNKLFRDGWSVNQRNITTSRWLRHYEQNVVRRFITYSKICVETIFSISMIYLKIVVWNLERICQCEMMTLFSSSLTAFIWDTKRSISYSYWSVFCFLTVNKIMFRQKTNMSS